MDEEWRAVSRLRQGDIDGLEPLVRSYHLPAVRAAYLVLGDRQQAEDVVQAVFLTLPDRIRYYDVRRPFRPWFLRCVVNAALNTVRRDRRLVPLERVLETEALGAVQTLVEQQLGPEATIEAHEVRDAVQRALAQLTPRQRAAIVLRYYLGLSEAEMVTRLDSPASSIKWWLHSAKQRLRVLLAPLWATPDE